MYNLDFRYIVFCLLIKLFLPISFALGQNNQSTGDFHVCYFSLNNEKEVTEMQRFTKKINRHSHCSVSVNEYLTEGDDPEKSFKKMVESGVRCDGLVISGHHTGSFGGKRATGSLGIDFLEKLSCHPKYSKWFNNINALWLQGCWTLGTGEVVVGEEDMSADYHTARVGALLEEGHLEQSIRDLNMEFSATLDQDNPLSSRYLRVFPAATVFGWTDISPGEEAKSELSIPFHVAHTARLINSQDAFPSDSPIKSVWTERSAVQYATSMISILNGEFNPQCQELAVKAWKAHGKVRNQATEYGFFNPDLNAYPSLIKTDDSKLKTAQFYDCLLKNSKDNSQFLKTLEEILKDPTLIRYTYNSLLERLKTLKHKDPKLYRQTIKALKKSSVLKKFLSNKLTGKRLGILRKIDYLAFYEEVYGKNGKMRSAIVDKAKIIFSDIPSTSYDEIDYKVTLFRALSKHGYLEGEKGLKFIQQVAQDENGEIRGVAMESVGRLSEKGLSVIRQGVQDEEAYVRAMAVSSAGRLGEKGLSVIRQGVQDEEAYVRERAVQSAGRLGEKGLSVIQKGIQDEDWGVRAMAVSSAGRLGEKGLSVIQKGIQDENWEVRAMAVKSVGRLGKKGLAVIQQGTQDQDMEVRVSALRGAMQAARQNTNQKKYDPWDPSFVGVVENSLPLIVTDLHSKAKEALASLKNEDPEREDIAFQRADEIARHLQIVRQEGMPFLRTVLERAKDSAARAKIQRVIGQTEKQLNSKAFEEINHRITTFETEFR